MRLGGFTALSFDCYGTLIDWEAGLRVAWAGLREAAGVDNDALFDLFGRFESAVQAGEPRMPYPEVLAAVFQRMGASLGVMVTDAQCMQFGASVGDWPAFGDTVEALRYLRQYYRLFILSNVDRASFARTAARLGVAFDGVYTAEDIGSYKPDVRNFEYLLARVGEFRMSRGQLLHVAQSLFHDIAPARVLRIASAWIDRGGRLGGGDEVGYAYRFEGLGALVAGHKGGK